jgi:hypothetical protein
VADDRDAEILQIFGGQARQEVAVDRVVAERRFVLPETEILEPGRDVHGRLQSAGWDNHTRPVVCKASTSSWRGRTAGQCPSMAQPTPSAGLRFLAFPNPVTRSILHGSKGATLLDREAGVRCWRNRRLQPKTASGAFRPFTRPILKSRSGSSVIERSSSQELRLRADSAPTGVASGRTGVRAKAAVPMAFAKQAERVVRSANPGFSC